MKYVLRSMVIFIALLSSACRSEELVDASMATATKTLRPLPTSSATASQVSPEQIASTLVPSDPTATPFVHIIREGDTLLSIAIIYGVGLEELVLVNPGIDPQFLSVGQSLRIPGPEGEAVDVLLPTPTPVSIKPSPVRCYESLTGEFRCFSTVTNDLPYAVEAISGIIGIYNQDGALIAQKSSESTLQFLPSKQSLPLSVVFTEKPPEYFFGDIEILSAIQVEEEVSRFVPVSITKMEWEPTDTGIGAMVSVQIEPLGEMTGEKYLLRVLGMVLDGENEIVGFRLIEEVINAEMIASTDVEFYIISHGPAIADVKTVAEMVRID